MTSVPGPAKALGPAENPVTPVVIPATMTGMEEVEVVVAHRERATVRAGDMFLKIDGDQASAIAATLGADAKKAVTGVGAPS